jgi:hypothetical protein
MFSFRYFTSRFTEVAGVIFLILQILLLDGDKKISLEERDNAGWAQETYW